MLILLSYKDIVEAYKRLLKEITLSQVLHTSSYSMDFCLISGKCQVLSIPLCKNVPYSTTVFPNVFQHKTQNEASIEVHRWWPLVERECSADLSFFLCSLYAPPCTILDTSLLPCRELCLRVQRGILPALDYLYHSRWPESLNCERFPRGGEEVCIDRPQNRSQVTVTPASGPATGEVTFDGAVD